MLVKGEASTSYFAYLLVQMATTGIAINLILIALNLLPLPPLDGSRIVMAFLSPRWAAQYAKLEPWGIPILLLLFVSISFFARQ